MAIINSVLIGKGRGKVGNVVLSNLKGQTILKSLNSSPSNPKSADQTAQRSKMAYAVKIWQVVFMFMANFKSYIKPLESGYNAFIRSAIKFITTPLTFDFKTIWNELVTDMNLKGNLDLALSGSIVGANLVMTFNKGSLVYNPSMCINIFAIDDSTGETRNTLISIDETQFNAGSGSYPYIKGADDITYWYFASPATKQNTDLVTAVIG